MSEERTFLSYVKAYLPSSVTKVVDTVYIGSVVVAVLADHNVNTVDSCSSSKSYDENCGNPDM
jgi:hypothetical protein